MEERNSAGGWLAGLAALLVAITGLIALFRSTDHGPGPSPSPSPIASPSVSPTAGPTISRSPKSSPPVRTTSPSPPIKPADPLAAISPKDCYRYAPSSLRIVEEDGGVWLLTDGSNRMQVLADQSDAGLALANAQQHGQLCYIGRDNTRSNRRTYITTYWAGGSATTALPGEDCLPYRRSDLDIRDEGSDWLLTDGQSRMAVYDNETDARNGLILAKAFSRQCFVGRGNTRSDHMTYVYGYWR